MPTILPWAPAGTPEPPQPKAHCVPVPDDVAEDEDKLFELIRKEFGEKYSASNCDVSEYTYQHPMKFNPGRADDCVVVFRNKADRPYFNVLRVYKLDPIIDGKPHRILGRADHPRLTYIAYIWDNTLSKGTFVGFIPAGCEHETTRVEVKYITFK